MHFEMINNMFSLPYKKPYTVKTNVIYSKLGGSYKPTVIVRLKALSTFYIAGASFFKSIRYKENLGENINPDFKCLKVRDMTPLATRE